MPNQSPESKPKSFGELRIVRIFIGIIIMVAISTIIQKCNHNPLIVEPLHDDWSTIKTSLNEISDSLYVGDYSKQKFCDCVLGKFRKNYPSESSIPKDTIGKLSYQYSFDCSSTLDSLHMNTQSKLFHDNISTLLLSQPIISSHLKDNDKVPFCDCVVSGIRSRYPVEVIGHISPKVSDSIYSTCIEKLGIK